MIGQVNKCVDIVKRQGSHSGRRNVQIFSGGKQEKKNPVEMDWNRRYWHEPMISKICR